MPSVYRPTMSDIITRVRKKIGDPAGPTAFFLDTEIQEYLDFYRTDLRYEGELIAPSIVNTASTNNQASTIFADYYSAFEDWENDVVLQGYYNGAAWVVVTPVLAEPIVGHWQFEANVFTSGTVPGQLPPLFATGKVYDEWAASADLLEVWAASFSAAYDIVADGQNLRRSQLMTAKLTLATQYRMRAKPRVMKMDRHDVMPEISSRRYRLLDSDDIVKGA